ncbi:MAG: 30S ribosomal protein S20, partial [Candidatus Zixiibacteriota bacterium]
MPSHKSCKKRMRTSQEVSLRNRALRTNVRNAIKAVRTEGNKDEAKKKLQIASRLLDRA